MNTSAIPLLFQNGASKQVEQELDGKFKSVDCEGFGRSDEYL